MNRKVNEELELQPREMSDEKEASMQVTPETPGQLRVHNPFESPTDYSRLQEQIVSSPTVFKTTKCSVTPGKFRWSIDKLASMSPVEIDSEDICRQALYLSQTRIDNEMEDKRQKAIEEKILCVKVDCDDYAGSFHFDISKLRQDKHPWEHEAEDLCSCWRDLQTKKSEGAIIRTR